MNFLLNVVADKVSGDSIPEAEIGLNIDGDSVILGIILGLVLAWVLRRLTFLIKMMISDYKERHKKEGE